MPRDPQQVALQVSSPEQPRVFRPIRTAKSFVLVVESRRVVARRWDKVEYQPGEKCQMSIVGERLGKGPLAVTVESENEDGSWTPVARLQAEVAEAEVTLGRATATVRSGAVRASVTPDAGA